MQPVDAIARRVKEMIMTILSPIKSAWNGLSAQNSECADNLMLATV